MENNKEESSKKVYIAMIALLLLINGVALYLLYSENKAKKDITEQKSVLQTDFNNLNDTLSIKFAELEELKGRNAEMDSMINSQQSQIEEQQKSIASLLSKGKMTSAELAKAKAMIAKYEASITDMKAQLSELQAEKERLSAENQQLTSDLNAEKATTSELTEQNRGLSRKVELGSLLQLRNVEAVGIKKKGSGKEAEVSRIKQLESLRISFETGDNKVLESGNVVLFIRIINPKGETISVADQGSGTITSAETGETIQYTKQADIDWQQSNKKVSVYWSQSVKEAGKYKIEVYQSGYLIGSTSAEFK